MQIVKSFPKWLRIHFRSRFPKNPRARYLENFTRKVVLEDPENEEEASVCP